MGLTSLDAGTIPSIYCYFLGENMLYFIVGASSFVMLYFTGYAGVLAAAGVISIKFLKKMLRCALRKTKKEAGQNN